MATRRHFTQEYKDQAVSLVLDSDRPTALPAQHPVVNRRDALGALPDGDACRARARVRGHRPAADRRWLRGWLGYRTVPHLAPRLAELVRAESIAAVDHGMLCRQVP